MFCSICGKKIASNAKVCRHCGSHLTFATHVTDLNKATLNAAAIYVKSKNVGLAFLLAALFGPIGMLYSTILGAFVMAIVPILIFIEMLGRLDGFDFAVSSLFLLSCYWAICVVWAMVAATGYNNRLLKGSAEGITNKKTNYYGLIVVVIWVALTVAVIHQSKDPTDGIVTTPDVAPDTSSTFEPKKSEELLMHEDNAAVHAPLPKEIEKYLDENYPPTQPNDWVVRYATSFNKSPFLVFSTGKFYAGDGCEENCSKIICGSGGCPNVVFMKGKDGYINLLNDQAREVRILSSNGIRIDWHGSVCGKVGVEQCVIDYIVSDNKLLETRGTY